MKVLFLAPQPFFQERGTPIAVKLALETLATRATDTSDAPLEIHLLVYGEGVDVTIPSVTIFRTWMPRLLQGVRPGISMRKLFLDALFFIAAIRLILAARRTEQYTVIHAVEESVFIAWLARVIFGVPYVYDMDSSLALQLTERWWLLKPLLPLFAFLERQVIRSSIAVAPVCDALAVIAHRHGASQTVMLRDVSLLPRHDSSSTQSVASALRTELGIASGQPLLLYVGNLETYQGIDLLLESFRLACSHPTSPFLAVIGGNERDIELYRHKAESLGCAAQVAFLGRRPLRDLKEILCSADILVSPRIKGNNTPMKVYSYLHSGRALLATDLPTHTQVLNGTISVLASPNPRAFSDGMLLLLSDPGLRGEIGLRAWAHAEKLYTTEAFEAQLSQLYDHIRSSLSLPNRSPPLPVQSNA
jgi:glycosyltransferase involved in cell wall biosynthesis